MPPRTWRVRAQDMLGAIERILDVTAGKSILDLDGDPLLLESVQFNFIVIGEAARHIPEPIRQRASEIPWLDISGMRNVIAHGYFDVNLPILWRTIEEDLPPLKFGLRRLLAEIDRADDARGE